MDPTINKVSTGNVRIVQSCASSESTARDQRRVRFFSVQGEIRAKMQGDKKTLLAAAAAEKTSRISGKDFRKMKSQYVMFVDAVGAKKVCVSVCVSHKITHYFVKRD